MLDFVESRTLVVPDRPNAYSAVTVILRDKSDEWSTTWKAHGYLDRPAVALSTDKSYLSVVGDSRCSIYKVSKGLIGRLRERVPDITYELSNHDGGDFIKTFGISFYWLSSGTFLWAIPETRTNEACWLLSSTSEDVGLISSEGMKDFRVNGKRSDILVVDKSFLAQIALSRCEAYSWSMMSAIELFSAKFDSELQGRWKEARKSGSYKQSLRQLGDAGHADYVAGRRKRLDEAIESLEAQMNSKMTSSPTNSDNPANNNGSPSGKGKPPTDSGSARQPPEGQPFATPDK